MKVTMLGCGGSGGVPLVGGVWGRCDPAEPRNRRRRVSILVEEGDTALIVDTSPDFRQQMLDADYRQLDGVLFTHACRPRSRAGRPAVLRGVMKAPIPVFANTATLRELRRRDAFRARNPARTTNRPWTRGRDRRAVPGRPDRVLPFVQDHGYGHETLGFRFGRIAYSTDVVRLDEAAFAALAGVDTWIVDCLRDEPHPTHSHLDQTLGWIRRVAPRRAILTHMSEQLDYRDLLGRLPPGVEPGYDGLVVQI
jgi:phosphoribosyl 1,2-cyclic phosphate phosphodiesterase